MTSLVASALLAIAETESHGKELPMPAWAFGLVAFGVLMLLLGFLWTFRNAGLKTDAAFQSAAHRGHRDPVEGTTIVKHDAGSAATRADAPRYGKKR